MTHAYLEVVRIMSRGDLNRSGSLLRIRIFIGDHRNFSVQNRQVHFLAHQIFVPFIAWMNRNRNVAEHGLRTGGRYHDALASVHCRITEIPILSVFVLMFYLSIRKGGLAARAPVNQTVAPVNPTFFVQIDEELGNGFVAALVHGEPLSPPVAGIAQFPALLRDPAAVFLFPGPSVLQEFLPGKFALVLAGFLIELVGYFYLSGNAGMVASRKPQRAVSLHSLPADQHVLQGLIQGMSHVKLSRNVWRRHHNGERFLVWIHLGIKGSGFFPCFINAILKVFGIVCLCKVLFHLSLPFPFRLPPAN